VDAKKNRIHLKTMRGAVSANKRVAGKRFSEPSQRRKGGTQGRSSGRRRDAPSDKGSDERPGRERAGIARTRGVGLKNRDGGKKSKQKYL